MPPVIDLCLFGKEFGGRRLVSTLLAGSVLAGCGGPPVEDLALLTAAEGMLEDAPAGRYLLLSPLFLPGTPGVDSLRLPEELIQSIRARTGLDTISVNEHVSQDTSLAVLGFFPPTGAKRGDTLVVLGLWYVPEKTSAWGNVYESTLVCERNECRVFGRKLISHEDYAPGPGRGRR